MIDISKTHTETNNEKIFNTDTIGNRMIRATDDSRTR